MDHLSGSLKEQLAHSLTKQTADAPLRLGRLEKTLPISKLDVGSKRKGANDNRDNSAFRALFGALYLHLDGSQTAADSSLSVSRSLTLNVFNGARSVARLPIASGGVFEAIEKRLPRDSLTSKMCEPKRGDATAFRWRQLKQDSAFSPKTWRNTFCIQTTFIDSFRSLACLLRTERMLKQREEKRP